MFLIFIACRIAAIHLFSNNDNSLGECLVEVESETDVRDALKKSNQYLGSRHIIEGKILIIVYFIQNIDRII